MLRNKKYGMGGAVQSFSSPMLAQGMQGGLSGFGTSGLGMFANGGKVRDFAKKNIGKKVRVNFRKEQGIIVGGEGDFVNIEYPNLGFTESVNAKLEPIYFVEDSKYAKGGEVVQLPPKGELTNKDNLLLKYHKVGSNYEFYVYEPISKEVSGYNQIKFVCKNSDCALKMNYKEFINYLYSELYLDDKKYAKGGQIASIGDSGIITDKNSMFVGKLALIMGIFGNMYEVYVGGRTTIVKKNGINIIPDEESYYADGGKTRKSGNVPRIAKKVAEVNALIEKGNELGVEVVDSSTTWQSPMKYKPIKYVNGILYIEYEELDLYLNNRSGIRQWKLKKDKVLKRNMEFDNPLNDIAKMYRKAIREREQYFADGGDVEDRDRYSSAKTMGRNSQDWEAQLKEYAGEHYKSLTPREREEIIADMQRGYDRNTHFAKGGKITHSFEARNISEKEKRATYVLAFGQEYDDESRRQHPLPLDIAYQVALYSLERKKNEMAKGGKTNTTLKKGDKVYTNFKYVYGQGLQVASKMDIGNTEKVYGVISNVKKIDTTMFYYISFENGEELSFPDFAIENFINKSQYAQGGEMESEDMDVQFIEYKDNEIMYEPHYKKYYANDVEFDSLKDAQKFLDSGKISNDIRGAYQRGLFAKGGQTNAKRSKITLIMDGQKYSYPVAIVNGQVEITDETFKDGVLREYLDKEFDLWLDQAPSDYEEMYYGDESIMSKRGAIEGAMEYVSLTIEDEAPKKTTFNFDEGDIEFDSAYEYERGGSIAVSDDEKRKSLKGNLKIKF